MALRFKNQVVVITGASSGIGEALAEEMAKQGAKLALLARRTDRLQALEERIKKAGSEAISVKCDVTSEADLAAAMKQTRERFGRIDVVVANAGFSSAGRFSRLSVADYRRQFDTNVFGALATAYAALEDLKNSKGKLVLVGSVMSYLSIPGTSPYAMSKYALRAFFEGIESELRDLGVKTIFIAPGFIKSEIRMVDNKGQFNAEAVDDVPSWIQMPAAKAARIIAGAIASGTRHKIVTGHAHLFIAMARHTPWVFRLATKLGLKRKRGNVVEAGASKKQIAKQDVEVR